MSTGLKGQLHRPEDGPAYVLHSSFHDPSARALYVMPEVHRASGEHLKEPQTIEIAQSMHYAAWRMDRARSSREKAIWEQRYYRARDEIVLGNRKLIYRAVQKWNPPSRQIEEMTSACHIVLIQTVAAYNPWMGVRFSTYAFTCLLRALSRLSRRQAADRLSSSAPIEIFAEQEAGCVVPEESTEERLGRIYEYLLAHHPLLSDREKEVIIRRFSLDHQEEKGTLEQVGREMGLSKERIRQIQITAIDKIRQAIGISDEVALQGSH